MRKKPLFMSITPLSHTMSESAKILNISLSQLWVLIRQDRLASYKVGKRRYISRAELERFVRESEEAARTVNRLAE
jgi:excisionase family DNA binding protein